MSVNSTNNMKYYSFKYKYPFIFILLDTINSDTFQETHWIETDQFNFIPLI